MTVEKTILKNLLHNETYCRKVLPFLKSQYFSNQDEKIIFEKVYDFILRYNTLPNENEIKLEVNSITGIKADVISSSNKILDEIKQNRSTIETIDWLLDQTEEFCKWKAAYLSMAESLELMNKKTSLALGSIPQKILDALAITFDPNIGHDYFGNSDDRFNAMHQHTNKVPFDLDYLNKITEGGIEDQTLNVILAPTGVGKTLMMCHLAAANLVMGKNVLYITLEMAEKKIAERIDANLLNIDLTTLRQIPKQTYDAKMASLKAKTNGKLIIKEYPPATSSANHFRALLTELKLKKGFIPDIIYIDYLNLCASARIGIDGSGGSYAYIKAIAEELRGLAVEQILPIWTATQTNRSGLNNSDLELGDTSESVGLPFTADFMIALISTEDLQKLNQLMIKQLKNRYGDVNLNRKFVVGIDRPKMRLYDIAPSVQAKIVGSDEQNSKPITSKFSGFKV